MSDPRTLVESLVAVVQQGGDLDASVAAALPGLDHAGLLAFLRAEPAWNFVLYELGGSICRKPTELSAAVLTALARELADERAG